MTRPLPGSSIDSLAHRGVAAVRQWPARALAGVITAYQRFLSPAMPVITLGACACRFSPTCSHYALGAVRTHGALRGGWLTLCRLIKCTPLHPGGFDPVPPANRRPTCQRLNSTNSLPSL